MYTPLEEVLAKDAWDDVDVEILVANRHVLPADVLERLGITVPKPLSPEEVAAQVAALGPVPEEGAADQTATTEGAPAPEIASGVADAAGEAATANVDNPVQTDAQ
jgi:hypothetical protein